MVIRTAETADCDELILLIEELYFYHENFNNNFKIDDNHFILTKNVLLDKIENANSEILICVFNTKIVGMMILSCTINQRFIVKNRGYIHETIVNEEYRGYGVGSKLINQANLWFENLNVEVIELQVSCLNTEAVSFWNKHGFQIITYHLLKSLKK
ncbi:GNAT family N-acetyltransferase [Flavobacterium sp. LHD-85]|uniref:GNAT family N-acetyltransferase n=1 Tax=Flavobacterium sp. LHD-85 TaxID=3071410 RepID=UPI0027E1499A|nr:GNAT family N-acetyltransferase [Flavobacterium sp. LHD-85]MDQ6531225.1 GNAT family N-acetyltransferase [Flavobacterium sp. LHD-85]